MKNHLEWLWIYESVSGIVTFTEREKGQMLHFSQLATVHLLKLDTYMIANYSSYTYLRETCFQKCSAEGSVGLKWAFVVIQEIDK